ncbi:MAG: META domain-containing protein [Ginsengibacter sp.]
MIKSSILIIACFYLFSCRPTAKIITDKKEVTVVESVSFTNTKWILASLNKKQPTFSMNEKPYILFKGNNEVSGNAGCNLFSGFYEISDSLMSFKNIIVTTAACPDLPIELDFIKVLGRTIGYGKSNQTLELKDLSGRTIALFSVK